MLWCSLLMNKANSRKSPFRHRTLHQHRHRYYTKYHLLLYGSMESPTAADLNPVPNAGSVLYTPWLLILYDLLVIHFSASFVWRCPTKTYLLPFFTENFSKRHLDIGVGTGYFPKTAMTSLEKSAKQGAAHDTSSTQHLSLADLNPHSLEEAKKRVLAKHPAVQVKTLLADALQPLPSALRGDKPFDSASLYFLLHCMPGLTADKTQAFLSVKDVLSDDGVLSGVTVLGKQWERVTDGSFRPKQTQQWWPLTSFLLGLYNKKGIFHNYEEDPQVLDDVLRQHYRDVETKIIGMVFMFRAARPIRKMPAGKHHGN